MTRAHFHWRTPSKYNRTLTLFISWRCYCQRSNPRHEILFRDTRNCDDLTRLFLFITCSHRRSLGPIGHRTLDSSPQTRFTMLGRSTTRLRLSSGRIHIEVPQCSWWSTLQLFTIHGDEDACNPSASMLSQRSHRSPTLGSNASHLLSSGGDAVHKKIQMLKFVNDSVTQLSLPRLSTKQYCILVS